MYSRREFIETGLAALGAAALVNPHRVLVGRAPHGSRARFFVDGQNLVATLLQDMLDLLTTRGAS